MKEAPTTIMMIINNKRLLDISLIKIQYSKNFIYNYNRLKVYVQFMKNFILGLLFAALLVGVAFFAYQTGKKEAKPASTVTPTSGAQTNEVSPTVNQTVQTTGEPTSGVSDADGIKQALLKKYPNWVADNIIVTVSKNDGKYSQGGVKEKNAEAGGGYFFAAKVQGEWKIVADGNGVIECDSLIPYPDFPKTLIPDCYDSKTGKTVTR